MKNSFYTTAIAIAENEALRKELKETIRQCRVSRQFLVEQISKSKEFIEEARSFLNQAVQPPATVLDRSDILRKKQLLYV